MIDSSNMKITPSSGSDKSDVTRKLAEYPLR